MARARSTWALIIAAALLAMSAMPQTAAKRRLNVVPHPRKVLPEPSTPAPSPSVVASPASPSPSPVVAVSPPPPSPPSPSPSPSPSPVPSPVRPKPDPYARCPFRPIKAYCLPFIAEDGTGCLLKIASAEPGSTLLFHLTSDAHEEVSLRFNLREGRLAGYKRFRLPNSIKKQAVLKGTVQYEGVPKYSWSLQAEDPTAWLVSEKALDEKLDGKQWLQTERKVQVTDSMMTLVSIRPVDA